MIDKPLNLGYNPDWWAWTPWSNGNDWFCTQTFVPHLNAQFSLYPLSSPIFVKPIAQCPQILLPYSYQVKFFTVISFFETWTHLRPGKPSSNFNFAQTYTVIIWNLRLSFPNYMFGTNGFMSQNKFFNTLFIQAQWAKSYQAQFKINRGLTN